MKNIVYNEMKYYVPERYYHKNLTDRFVKKMYEKEEIYLSSKYFDKQDNILELGSCLGVVASTLSKCCEYVTSIEANPELSEALSLTKQENNLENVEFLSGYLDMEDREVEFQTYDNIVAGSGDREDLTINNVRGWGDSLKKYMVKTIRLDDIAMVDKINCVVIDIEGGELVFLKNFGDFLKTKIKKLCIELHGHLMSDSRFNNKCLSLIKSYGFKLREKVGISYYFEK